MMQKDAPPEARESQITAKPGKPQPCTAQHRAGE